MVYFWGFHRSETFEGHWSRLERLGLWRELVVRPESRETCHEEDRDLFDREKKKTPTARTNDKKGGGDGTSDGSSSSPSPGDDGDDGVEDAPVNDYRELTDR